MKKVIMLSLLFCATSAPANDFAQVHAFTAQVSKVRLSSQLIESGKSRTSSTTINVKSIIYNPPLNVPNVVESKGHENPEISILISYYASIITESGNEILEYWHPAEREGKKALIGNADVLARMKKHFSANPSLEIVGVVYQKESASVLISLGGFVVGNTLRQDGDKLYLSDKPSDDLELAIIEASFDQK